jgi:hypothetical protein
MINDDTDSCSNCSKRAVNRREPLALAGASTGIAVLGGAVSGCGSPTGTPPTGPFLRLSRVGARRFRATSIGCTFARASERFLKRGPMYAPGSRSGPRVSLSTSS